MRLSIACTLLSRLRGLSRDVSEGRVLLLAPCNDIHTFTMRRNIDIAFISQDGVVLESRRNVTPRQRLRNRRATITLERFSRDDSWYEPGDYVCLALPPKRFDCQLGLDECEQRLESRGLRFKSEGSLDLEIEDQGRSASDHEDMSRMR